MATQAYRGRLTTTGKNSGTARPARPARPELPVKAGVDNKTPPPVTTAELAVKKDTAWGRGGDQANPGGNAYGGARSIPPGFKAAPAAVNPHGGTDAVLDGLVAGGVRGLDGSDDWQTRSLTDPGDRNRGRVPVNPGTSGARPGGTVPSKCGGGNNT
jgi:hypothetical protein